MEKSFCVHFLLYSIISLQAWDVLKETEYIEDPVLTIAYRLIWLDYWFGFNLMYQPYLATGSVFGAYVEGPSAGVGAEVAHLPGTPIASAGASAEASACKAGVKAGPVFAEFNPNLVSKL